MIYEPQYVCEGREHARDFLKNSDDFASRCLAHVLLGMVLTFVAVQ